MPKHAASYDLLTVQRVAYLRAEFGMTQQDIADALGGEAAGFYQYTVNRLLKVAKQLGLLTERTTYQFHHHGLPPERLALIKDVRTWKTVRDRLRLVRAMNGVVVRNVFVFPSGRGDTELRLRKFAVQAAGALANQLRQSSTFAVAWGTTIAHVIDELGALGFEPPERPLEFIPVRAEEVGARSQRTSSSALAARLDKIVNGKSLNGDDIVTCDSLNGGDARPQVCSLYGVPAFTPHSFAEDVRFREYLHGFETFHEIFGLTEKDRRLGTKAVMVHEPLIKSVDGLLTSVGTRQRPGGDFYEQLKKEGCISAEELSRIVDGDVGGVLIPAAQCTRADLARVTALNEIFTGLQREHLEDMAVRAQRDRKPGVIIVSVGDAEGARARTLAGVVRAGLVNELIIDRQLAGALMALLDQSQQPVPGVPPAVHSRQAPAAFSSQSGPPLRRG